MNKLFTKIATLVLGMTTAVGVGVAVGSGSEAVNPVAAVDGSVEISVANYAEDNGWTSGTKYTSMEMDTYITASMSASTYTGTYHSSDGWKVYETDSGEFTITANNATLTYITIVWKSAKNSGCLKLGSTVFKSNTRTSVTGNSVTFTAGHSSGSKVGQIGMSSITVEYSYTQSKTLSSISLGGTYQDEFTVGDTFNHTGMTVTANYDDDSTADVTGSATWSSPDMSTTGTKTVTVSYTEGGTTKTADYTITVNESTTPTILLDSNSFAGYTGQSFSVTATYSNLTSAFAWSTSGSGTTTETITSTGTETDGTSTYSGTLTGEGTKVLTATGGGVSEQARPTFTITITQTLRPVMAPTPGEKTTSTLTFKEKYSEGGATSDGGEKWTVTSDGAESTYDATKGIHYGTGSASVQYIKLTSNDFTSGKITKVVANASTASGVTATVAVNVGGNAFGGDPQSISQTATNYTFNGEVDAGVIEVIVTKPSSATKAIYCKSIAVTYETEGKSVNIANAAGHEAAQHAVVRFAKRFNAIMDGTNNCTTGLSDAWSAITLVYDNPSAQTEAEKGFLQDIASLSSTEQDYAKKMIKYATAQWTEDTDENYEYCLERAMATYEYCVKKHEGCTAFMDSVRPVERTHVNPISIFGSTENTNAIAIVVIVSVVSLTAIGGYFFLRKKREQN